MKSSRFTEERIIGILKERQAGLSATDLCWKHGISDATFYTWRSKYGGMEVCEALGWESILCVNAGRREMPSGLREFGDRIGTGAVGVKARLRYDDFHPKRRPNRLGLMTRRR